MIIGENNAGKYLHILIHPLSRSRRRTNAETGTEVVKQRFRKAFCEDICILVAGWHMKNSNLAESNLFTNKVYIHLNVFGPLVVDRVFREIYSTNVITIYNCGFLDGTVGAPGVSSVANRNSATTFATPRYSASALERDRVGCRLADQDMRLLPR